MESKPEPPDASDPSAAAPLGRHTRQLGDVSFAVVDVETTGTNPATDRIVQMAAVVVNGRGEVVDSFDTVVRPENPASYVHGAEEIHGISPEDVERGMPLSDALARLWEISDGHVFAAHNARFDISFLQAESRRVGIERTVDRYLDTLELSRSTDANKERSHSLAALCSHYGIERTGSHEALADATATAQLLVRLIDEVDGDGSVQLRKLFDR